MTSEVTKGCFGSALFCNPKSEGCKTCSLYSTCYSKSGLTLSELKAAEIDTSVIETRRFQSEVENSKYGKVKVEKIVSTNKRQALTTYQEAIINNDKFPIKSRNLIASLFRKGITGKYLTNLMSSGVNPFLNSKPAILDAACRLIIANKLSKKRLVAFYEHLGQSRKTALSQSNIVITSFLIMGVIDKDLKLRRE